MRRSLVTIAPTIPGWLAMPVGLPWPAVFVLALIGLGIATALAWSRESHRHTEVMTALRGEHGSPVQVQDSQSAHKGKH